MAEVRPSKEEVLRALNNFVENITDYGVVPTYIKCVASSDGLETLEIQALWPQSEEEA